LSSADTKILKKFANDYNLSFYNLLVSAYLYSIYNITKDNLELEYIIEVTPAANFHNLNYVGVIK